MQKFPFLMMESPAKKNRRDGCWGLVWRKLVKSASVVQVYTNQLQTKWNQVKWIPLITVLQWLQWFAGKKEYDSKCWDPTQQDNIA